MTQKQCIRVKSVCVFRKDGRVLLEKGFDHSKQQSYYVPPGGAVKFGERAADAIRREIREEFQAKIRDITLLGTLESFFTWDGEPVHEIVFVFDARFEDASYYRVPVVKGHETDGGDIEAFWRPVRELRAEPVPVYPEGLLQLLLSSESRIP